jgi:hypothetical protein
MGQNVSRRRALALAVLSTVIAVAVAVPASVWATHQFFDVSNANVFHDDISAIADAGITTGFNDGGFHPTANVTRQAMAAFLGRGLGRIGSNKTHSLMEPISLSPNTSTALTSVAVDPGAVVSGTTGFVLVTGTANFTAQSPTLCPCFVELSISDAGGVSSPVTRLDIPGTANESGLASASATVQGVFAVSGGDLAIFTLLATSYDSSSTVKVVGRVTALYAPFGPDGDDTQTYCSKDEQEPNGNIASAQNIGGSPMYGCIEPGSDRDYYRVPVSGGSSISAYATGMSGFDTCDTDTFIEIRDSTDVIVNSNDDDGLGPCSSVTSGPLIGGTYYVVIRGFDLVATGPYSFYLSITPPGKQAPDEIQPRDANDKT